MPLIRKNINRKYKSLEFRIYPLDTETQLEMPLAQRATMDLSSRSSDKRFRKPMKPKHRMTDEWKRHEGRYYFHRGKYRTTQ